MLRWALCMTLILFDFRDAFLPVASARRLC